MNNNWYNFVPEILNSEEEYITFVSEIKENKPLTKLSELEKYREAIYIFFSFWPLIAYGLRDSFKYWANYVDTSVYIAKNADSEKIKNFKWNKIYDAAVLPQTYINDMFTLLLPDHLYEDSFHRYIDGFNDIMTFNNRYWKEIVDTGIEEFNEILRYLHDLSQINRLTSNERIRAFFVAYLYLNKSKDYDILKDYELNQDYYNEKMKLNNCFIINQYGTYDYENVKLLFDNFDSIFKREKTLIK